MTTITEEIAAAEVSKAWFDLVEKDDRNSPEEYPDMCLITREELAGYLTAALSKFPPAPDGWRNTATAVLTAAKKHIDPVVQYRLIATIDELLTASPSPSPPDRNAVIDECAKIEHRGIFIERQSQGGSKYLFICHTGISKFLPDLYETQAQAINAVDAKLDRGLSILLRRAKHHIKATLDLTEENRLALAVQGRALIREIEAALPTIRAIKTNPGNAATAP